MWTRGTAAPHRPKAERPCGRRLPGGRLARPPPMTPASPGRGAWTREGHAPLVFKLTVYLFRNQFMGQRDRESFEPGMWEHLTCT